MHMHSMHRVVAVFGHGDLETHVLAVNRDIDDIRAGRHGYVVSVMSRLCAFSDSLHNHHWDGNGGTGGLATFVK